MFTLTKQMSAQVRTGRFSEIRHGEENNTYDPAQGGQAEYQKSRAIGDRGRAAAVEGRGRNLAFDDGRADKNHRHVNIFNSNHELNGQPLRQGSEAPCQAVGGIIGLNFPMRLAPTIGRWQRGAAPAFSILGALKRLSRGHTPAISA